MKQAAFVVAAVLLSACGRNGPSSPTRGAPATPAPAPPPTFRDGWTDQPVTANEVAPPAPQFGTFTSVRAAGYLTREAWFRGEPFYLWPQSEEYVGALVYNEWVPQGRLSRWQSGFVVADVEGASAEVAAAAAEAAHASGLSVTVAASGAVRIEVDPNDPYLPAGTGAVTYNTFRGNVVTGSRIVFKSFDHITGRGRRYDNLLLHELGHVLGLGHSSERTDVMYVENDRADEVRFSDRERVTLRLMYRFRESGNTFPDRAPFASTALAGERTVAIVD